MPPPLPDLDDTGWDNATSSLELGASTKLRQQAVGSGSVGHACTQQAVLSRS
jgi:hypothetical protein